MDKNIEESDVKYKTHNSNKCFICGKIIDDKEKLKNQFEVACKQHEGIGELSTHLFFEKYRDYTKW